MKPEYKDLTLEKIEKAAKSLMDGPTGGGLYRIGGMLINEFAYNLIMEELKKIENPLYGWVFIKGIDGNWATARRDDYFELFNGDKGNILKSKHIEDLVSLITQGEGDKFKIQKLLNNN